MRTLEHIVLESESGLLLKTLVPRIFHLGTHAFRRLKVQNSICVNGISRHVSYVVKPGDLISITLETSEFSETKGDLISPDSTLVPYLDDDLMIINKPAPLATIPGSRDSAQNLRSLIAEHLGYDPNEPFHPVNRLDKGTSGLLCVARHAHAQHLLTKQLHTNTFMREYLAITEGIPLNDSGRINAPIARSGSGVRRCISPDGKPSITNYTVVDAGKSRALIRLRLETGRTHQIRVHLSSIGCPIVGDYLYGHPHPDLQDRFALHSSLLTCKQPITGDSITVESALPEILRNLLD